MKCNTWLRVRNVPINLKTSAAELSSDLLTGSVACLPHQYSIHTLSNNTGKISMKSLNSYNWLSAKSLQIGEDKYFEAMRTDASE